jgi:hypothetical protein
MLRWIARLLRTPRDGSAGAQARRRAPAQFQLCGVFVVRKRLYLGREEGHAGPGLLLFPPQELALDIPAEHLGRLVHEALASYRETGVPIPAPEWEVHNARLLAHFGFASVADFERSKRDITIRRIEATGEVRLFGSRGDAVATLLDPGPEELGAAIREHLRLPAAVRRT